MDLSSCSVAFITDDDACLRIFFLVFFFWHGEDARRDVGEVLQTSPQHPARARADQFTRPPCSLSQKKSTKQSVLNPDRVHQQRLGWRSTHTQVRVFVGDHAGWILAQCRCPRTQSVIAQSSCEAEYIAATAATSEAKYIQALFLVCGQHVNIHLRSDSSGAIKKKKNKQKRFAAPPSSGRAISAVASRDRQSECSDQQGARSGERG